jgi:hypothetical protein
MLGAMPKRASKTKDMNELAYDIVQRATGQRAPDPDAPPKNPAAVALGKLGGKKGGAARAAKLSPKRRLEIARKAAKARWKGHKP